MLHDNWRIYGYMLIFPRISPFEPLSICNFWFVSVLSRKGLWNGIVIVLDRNMIGFDYVKMMDWDKYNIFIIIAKLDEIPNGIAMGNAKSPWALLVLRWGLNSGNLIFQGSQFGTGGHVPNSTEARAIWVFEFVWGTRVHMWVTLRMCTMRVHVYPCKGYCIQLRRRRRCSLCFVCLFTFLALILVLIILQSETV